MSSTSFLLFLYSIHYSVLNFNTEQQAAEAAEAAGDCQALEFQAAYGLALLSGVLGESRTRGRQRTQRHFLRPRLVVGTAGWSGLDHGVGTGTKLGGEGAFANRVQQRDSFNEQGVLENISGEMLLCDADNLDKDTIYPEKRWNQDNASPEDMTHAFMSNCDAFFYFLAKPRDILVGLQRWLRFLKRASGNGPASEADRGSRGWEYSEYLFPNTIKNALMGLEVPRLVERLRLRSSGVTGNRPLTRRAGWTVTYHE
ncbi:hypothetical protein DCS_02391 [Drechmeria coniospora]|uniref:Uncharacterized protein n=1 Tax=Drechmeria coniospora TaxID=98403 RepID=A0A151GVW9_DRECN|nr:hypothetical protein DCS_02391 [Drechmeria coniospora]KYK61249.1 hypothetical protein DCS_02391 [Drechmeria coniospora]